MSSSACVMRWPVQEGRREAGRQAHREVCACVAPFYYIHLCGSWPCCSRGVIHALAARTASHARRFLPVGALVTVVGEACTDPFGRAPAASSSSSASSSPSTSGSSPSTNGSSSGSGLGSRLMGGLGASSSSSSSYLLRRPVRGGPFYITPLTLEHLHAAVATRAKFFKVGAVLQQRLSHMRSPGGVGVPSSLLGCGSGKLAGGVVGGRRGRTLRAVDANAKCSGALCGPCPPAHMYACMHMGGGTILQWHSTLHG